MSSFYNPFPGQPGFPAPQGYQPQPQFGQPQYGQPQFAQPQPVKRAHTPEPDPNYNAGRILQNPMIPVTINGMNMTAPAGYDVVSDMILNYDVISPEYPTGIRQKIKNGRQGQYTDVYVHLFGRVSKHSGGTLVINGMQYAMPACIGITLHGDMAMLQAAGQLKRGTIVSFTGRLAIGKRYDQRSDIFLNATSFFNPHTGNIVVPVSAPVHAPQAVMPQQTAYAQPPDVTPLYAPQQPPAVAAGTPNQGDPERAF